MGTVGYMAPEQVRGADVDARADLFALGCVLYEMLTGQRAFRRETPAETMTAILHEDPADVTATRADLTPSLDRIVRHCLEKNPHERFQTARDVAFALSALSGSASAPALAIPARRASRATLAWAALSAVLAGIVLWQGVWPRRESSAAPAAVPYRVTVPLPEGFYDSDSTYQGLKLGVSPDGRRVVVRGTTSGARNQLWVGSLVDGTFRAMADTEAGLAPAWSPDGTRIAFSSRQQLRVISAEGGSSTVVGDRGYAAWGADDVLLVARLGTSLFRASASGGPYRAVHERKGSEFFGLPWFLDDGRRYIYGLSDREHPDADGIYRASLDGPPPVRIFKSTNDVNVAYANGALLHVRGAALMAQPLDIDTGQTTGAAVTIAEDVDAGGSRGAAFSVSRTGTLVYLPFATASLSRLTWVNRRGERLSTVADDADYNSVQLSRDGQRLAVSVTDPAARARDIYLVDLARGVRQRLTFDPSDERSAVWSPDGRSVVYNAKGLDLYTRSSDFTGGESAVLGDGRSKDPNEISSDGRFLLYRRSGDGTGNDIWIVALSGDRTPRLLAGTPFDETYATFSPDGTAIVYASDESGDSEIYVMRIDGAGGKMLVSNGGGSFPRWRRDGREILYLGPDNTMMSVPLTGDGAAMQPGPASALFQVALQPGPSWPYDVTANGERFLVNVALPSKTPTALRMIVNWPALLGTAK
jgi:Tol biopolymer transport system component